MLDTVEMDPAQEYMAKVMLRQKAMIEATARGDSAVQQFYRGAAVFVTGGSGFLGKQLIEKLLRATKTSKIFVLLRSKKQKSIEQRLNEMLQDPVYEMVREQEPGFADRIVPVAGDVAELKLGLSDKDWKTISEQVNIIFHLAATTRFDESLRVATMINVRGAREALLLGKACKNLTSYVHVSTAYSHACENMINSEVQEDFYKSPIDPETLISLVDSVDEEKLNECTASLIKNWPNTYSFCKAVAEETVKRLSVDMPVCIVRPAIIIVAAREPHPGWLDVSNVYGASGIILGPGIGLMHVLFCNYDVQIGLVPVDYVNNSIIVAAWYTAKNRPEGEVLPKIYTACAPTRNPVEWRDLQKTITTTVKINYQTPAAVWYTGVLTTSNNFLFWLFSLFLHTIPAYFIDGICALIGKERRFVKLYSKMYKLSTSLSYFTVNNWRFLDDNMAALYDTLSTVDQEIFNFDVKNIDWADYMVIWCLGLRKFIVKDGLKGSKYAAKKQFVFKILNYIILPIYIYCLYKLLSCLCSVIFIF